jgi:hypothetical protein
MFGLSGVVGCGALVPARVTNARVVGVDDGGPGRGPAAVVAYQAPWADRDALFVVPVGSAEGEPFVYHGTKRSPSEILADLTPERRQRILAARLTSAPGGWQGWPGAGGDGSGGPRATRPFSTPFRAYPEDGLILVAIGRAGSVDAPEPHWVEDSAGRRLRYPEDCTILILPDEQPRDERELARERTKAVLLLPFQIVAGVAFIPAVLTIYTVGFVTGTLPRC